MTKWSAINVIVTSNDPGDFSALVNYFDLIVVDAPCSGSGLFRRAPDAINEWSENAVEICHLRQKRILSAAMPSLKEGGILVYSTCSYSPLEDESIAEWLCAEFSLETIRIPLKESWNIVETASVPHQAYGYRFFPDKLGGEGLYVCCFRKTGSVNQELKLSKKGRLSSASASDASIVRPWISDQAKDLGFYFHDEDLFAFPAMLEQDLNAIKQHLYIRHAGINIGRIMKMELIPDHAFALSGLVNKKIPSITLKKDEALQYLRKEEVKIDEGAGWALINYEGRNLGWIKRLKNRANNYYPKEWRILKSAITN